MFFSKTAVLLKKILTQKPAKKKSEIFVRKAKPERKGKKIFNFNRVNYGHLIINEEQETTILNMSTFVRKLLTEMCDRIIINLCGAGDFFLFFFLLLG